jgi:hypothetical protein
MAKKDQKINVTVEIVRVKDMDVSSLLRLIENMKLKQRQAKEGA